MIFEITKASEPSFCEKRDIQSLEDLRKLAEEYAPEGFEYEDLIIDFGRKPNHKANIRIYDDYIE